MSQHKEEWKRHQLLPVWKVALMAALFGVVVSILMCGYAAHNMYTGMYEFSMIILLSSCPSKCVLTKNIFMCVVCG